MAVIPAMENVALWHERDISHSSVERMIGPDATVTLDFALHRLAGVIEKLVIYPDNMMANMNKFRGLVHSQRVLLALTQAGVSREDAYRLVQRNAMKVWEEGKDFREELLADAEVTAALSPGRDRGEIRPRLPHQACGHDLRGCSVVAQMRVRPERVPFRQTREDRLRRLQPILRRARQEPPEGRLQRVDARAPMRGVDHQADPAPGASAPASASNPACGSGRWCSTPQQSM
jgi:hypothetical protein